VSSWVLCAYFAVGIVKGISRSRSERFVVTPTVLVLAVLYLVLN
jgi:hypothetical protein